MQTKDNAGNFAATYGTLFVYRFDSSSPAIGSPTISIEEGSANMVFEAENHTLFYSAQSSGAVSIGATITDYYSGADRMEFPAMFGETAATVTASPFTKRYPITGAESSVGAYRLTGFDQAGNSAQSTALILIKDLSEPVMSTAEAPGTSGLMIPVRWAGADEFGGAGLRGYNVEMREGSGEWSRWLTETTQTQADFPGEDGKQYSFRVQGVDRVGNAGAWLETAVVTTNAVTKYYALGGQRVAMRQGAAIYYLYGDHLGSTSLVTDATGTTLTETRYEPYGQPYWQWGATRTDFGFTGQRLDGFGLMDYNARYYSSTLGRFVSPDSIIPQPGSPLAWDRYSYSINNPINYTDPSGHWPEGGSIFNPFNYDTLTIGLRFEAKGIIGGEINLSANINLKALREGNFKDFDISFNVNGGASVGASVDSIFGVTLSGSDGSVKDQAKATVVGLDGAAFNVGGCFHVCGKASATLDGRADNGSISSISYELGGGEGFDASVDMFKASDYFAYIKYGEEPSFQIPVANEGFWIRSIKSLINDVNDFGNIFRKKSE